MSKICTVNWNDFKLVDVFKIKKTKNINSDDLIPGKINYVTRTAENNGVEKFVDDDRMILNSGNCITIGGESAKAFYQDKPFLTGNNITTIAHKNMNKYIGIFICTILNLESYRYSYGRAWNKNNVEQTIIKLPSKNGNPDWEYMQDFIKENYIYILNHFTQRELKRHSVILK